MMMQPGDSTLFTPTEAAVLTHLPLKAVNNAIDKKTVAATTGRRAGQVSRLLDLHALMSLTLERRLASRFPPELRREVFSALRSANRQTISLEDGFLRIDLRQPRRELATSLRDLRRARRLVSTDPAVMGGDPVFKGTRVPVHLIAQLLEQGAPAEELREGYPSLTANMLQAAPLYASAYPLRGRPRAQPWQGLTPVKISRRPLAIPGAT